MSSSYSRALAPAREEYSQTQPEPVRRRLKLLRYVQGVIIAAGALAGFGCLLYDPANVINRLLHGGSDAIYFITVNPVFLPIPMIMAGILLVGVLIEHPLRLLAGPYVKQWQEYSTIQPNDEVTVKTYKALAVIVLVVCGLVLLPAMDAYIRIDNDGVAVNHFLGVGETRYNWGQVRAVQRVSSGRMYRWRIVFNDGSDWTSCDSSFGVQMYNVIDPAVAYVSGKSGREVEVVQAR